MYGIPPEQENGMEKKNESRNADAKVTYSGTRSIARRINLSFWWDKLTSFFWVNVTAVLVSAAAFTIKASDLDFPYVIRTLRKIDAFGNSLDSAGLLLTLRDGQQLTLMAADWAELYLPVFTIVVFLEILDLVGSLSGTYRIRRQLRPLDRLASQATAFSKMSLDATKFDSLERAIRRAEDGSDSVDDMTITTGDRDLANIENALNSLLHRMQEGYRQQVRFASDASHELRTPIAVIQGYADMLDRWGKNDPEILSEGISSIKNEAAHMHELVEQLLFLARGDSGRNTLQKSRFDLCAMLSEVCEESQMIDEKHTYELRLDSGMPGAVYELRPDEGAPDTGRSDVMPQVFMTGDEGMIKQSVRIFLQNAAKYSPEGSVIRLRGGIPQGSGINGSPYYSVEDEGSGISREDVEHIFERFYRSDKARSSKTGGTGLGLAIAKWIIDAHNGSVDVVSRQDFGTRFTVSFPPEPAPGKGVSS